jgi:DNA repair exonuclease SbcCD ATPase subunit
MIEQLKTTLEKSQRRLESIVDKIEDEFEDLSEDTAELWQQAKPRLKGLKKSISTAIDKLHIQTEEAHLQAHLAAMDAHDQWSYLNDTVSGLVHELSRKGTADLEHAALQSHLAKMDARDFMNTRGKEISHDFKHGREKFEKASHSAAKELEKSFDNMGKALDGTF